MASDVSAVTMESKPRQQRHTMTSFSVLDILGNTESRPRSRDQSDVTAWQRLAEPAEMTSLSPPTHNAMVNKVCAGSGNLRWLQVLQQHPTRELRCIISPVRVCFSSIRLAYQFSLVWYPG